MNAALWTPAFDVAFSMLPPFRLCPSRARAHCLSFWASFFDVHDEGRGWGGGGGSMRVEGKVTHCLQFLR